MNEWSGRFIWLGTLFLLTIPVSVTALEINIKSDTILRGFERDTSTKEDATVVPIYEYLQIDAEQPNEPGLAFHFYGWRNTDLADSDYYSRNADGELLYSYLEYSREPARFNARLGRQLVFEGVANETIDGLRISSDLGRYFSGSLYGGLPVSLNTIEGTSGDSIFGGRIAHHQTGRYDLGISYKKTRNDSNDAGEMTGLDLSAYLPYNINLFGSSTYNLESEDWAEHSYEMRFQVGQVALRPYVQKFNYDDYFTDGDTTTNGPFRFLATSDEVLTVGGADLTISSGEQWVLIGKAKNYDYDVLDDSSQYFAAQAIWSGDGNRQIGSEFGKMNGDTPVNTYYLVRAFTYWDQLPESMPIKFISGDIVYVGYDEEIYGEDGSLFLSLGAGRDFMSDALEMKISMDYSRDPYFEKDFRGTLTASYRFGLSL